MSIKWLAGPPPVYVHRDFLMTFYGVLGLGNLVEYEMLNGFWSPIYGHVMGFCPWNGWFTLMCGNVERELERF